jgi:phosphatidylethanolamine-binding protein (PEBP) family uncharacterized protein
VILRSPDFEDQQEIPQKHGKKIENVSPQLSWADATAETRSFALSVVDRHPVAGNYVHWRVVGINADVTSLKAGAAGAAMPGGPREMKPRRPSLGSSRRSGRTEIACGVEIPT